MFEYRVGDVVERISNPYEIENYEGEFKQVKVGDIGEVVKILNRCVRVNVLSGSYAGYEHTWAGAYIQLVEGSREPNWEI